jgi:hypothetical protein
MADDKPEEKPPSKELAKPGDMLVIAELAAKSEAPKVPVSSKTKKGR